MANMFGGMGLSQDPRMMEMMRRKLGASPGASDAYPDANAYGGMKPHSKMANLDTAMQMPGGAQALGPALHPMQGNSGMIEHFAPPGSTDPDRAEALEEIRERLRQQMMGTQGGGSYGGRMNMD